MPDLSNPLWKQLVSYRNFNKGTEIDVLKSIRLISFGSRRWHVRLSYLGMDTCLCSYTYKSKECLKMLTDAYHHLRQIKQSVYGSQTKPSPSIGKLLCQFILPSYIYHCFEMFRNVWGDYNIDYYNIFLEQGSVKILNRFETFGAIIIFIIIMPS